MPHFAGWYYGNCEDGIKLICKQLEENIKDYGCGLGPPLQGKHLGKVISSSGTKLRTPPNLTKQLSNTLQHLLQAGSTKTTCNQTDSQPRAVTFSGCCREAENRIGSHKAHLPYFLNNKISSTLLCELSILLETSQERSRSCVCRHDGFCYWFHKDLPELLQQREGEIPRCANETSRFHKGT